MTNDVTAGSSSSAATYTSLADIEANLGKSSQKTTSRAHKRVKWGLICLTGGAAVAITLGGLSAAHVGLFKKRDIADAPHSSVKRAAEPLMPHMVEMLSSILPATEPVTKLNQPKKLDKRLFDTIGRIFDGAENAFDTIVDLPGDLLAPLAPFMKSEKRDSDEHPESGSTEPKPTGELNKRLLDTIGDVFDGAGYILDSILHVPADLVAPMMGPPADFGSGEHLESRSTDLKATQELTKRKYGPWIDGLLNFPKNVIAPMMATEVWDYGATRLGEHPQKRDSVWLNPDLMSKHIPYTYGGWGQVTGVKHVDGFDSIKDWQRIGAHQKRDFLDRVLHDPIDWPGDSDNNPFYFSGFLPGHCGPLDKLFNTCSVDWSFRDGWKWQAAPGKEAEFERTHGPEDAAYIS